MPLCRTLGRTDVINIFKELPENMLTSEQRGEERTF